MVIGGVLTYSNEHARVDRKGQVIQEVVVFSNDEGLHIGAAVQSGQKTSEGHIREEELV